MKYLSLLCLLLVACSGGKEVKSVEDAQIVFKGGLKGIECAHTAIRYNSADGQCKVQAMIKQTTDKKYKYLQLNASYRDFKGDEITTSIGGPEYVLQKGDSTLIETSTLFTGQLPDTVVLTVTN